MGCSVHDTGHKGNRCAACTTTRTSRCSCSSTHNTPLHACSNVGYHTHAAATPSCLAVGCASASTTCYQACLPPLSPPPSHLLGVCLSRTSAPSALTQLLTVSRSGCAVMASSRPLHQAGLQPPDSFTRAISSRDSRRGLPPGITASECLPEGRHGSQQAAGDSPALLHPMVHDTCIGTESSSINSPLAASLVA